MIYFPSQSVRQELWRGKKCASSYILWSAVYPREKWWVHDLLLSLKTSDAGSLFSNKWQLHSKEKNNTQLKVERTWLQNLLLLCRRPSSFFLSSLDIFHLKNFHLFFVVSINSRQRWCLRLECHTLSWSWVKIPLQSQWMKRMGLLNKQTLYFCVEFPWDAGSTGVGVIKKTSWGKHDSISKERWQKKWGIQFYIN